MDMSEDDTTDSHVIQMKTCPRCRTTIRRSLRYSAIIKQQLQDIENVKEEMLKNTRFGLQTKVNLLLCRLTCLATKINGETHERLMRAFGRLDDHLNAAVLENKVMLMERFCVMYEKMKVNLRRLPVEVCKEHNLEGESVLNLGQTDTQYFVIGTSGRHAVT